ncbi:MAG: PepSY domain-containing protein [Nocardioides sp.]|uniref:PepSY domain-containing protein n=1 Tax=Nocardioides sp. TaxID=35761 RepID=UPI003F074C62
MRTNRTVAALALLVAVGVSLTACGDDEDSRPRGTTTQSSPGSTDPTETGPTGNDQEGESPTEGTDPGEVDLVSVVQSAQDLVAGGSVVAVEWENDAGREGWEVTLTAAGRGVELLLAPDDLSEVSRRDVRLDADEKKAPTVAAEEAVSVASAEVPGIAEGISLDSERGAAVWDVDVRGAEGMWEVRLDAVTGDVLRKERDD